MLFTRRHLIWGIPCTLAARPQEPQDPPKAAELRFFSGRVEEVTGESISVSRELASRKHEVRTFVRTADTIVSGALKKGAKVTVAFTTVDGNHVAHRVIVRA